jgi:hypothetical protein
MRKTYLLASAVAVMGLTACGDQLGVTNVNNPDVVRAYSTPEGIEGVIAGLGAVLYNAERTNDGANTQSKMLSLESGTTVNNFGGLPRLDIPRNPILNTVNNDVAAGNLLQFQSMSVLTRTASNAVAGVYRLLANGGTIGSVGRNERARAFGYFILAQALGNLAAAYDSAAIVTPATPSAEIPPLSHYAAVNTAAIAMLDSAEAAAVRAAADDANFTLPTNWLSARSYTRADFIRLVRSFRAKIRVGAVRTPAERAAVNWPLVIADAAAGITSDFIHDVGGQTGWNSGWVAAQGYAAPSWSFANMYYNGMADTSGAYRTWLATPRLDREAFLVRTPDLRWPQGATRAAQQAEAPTNVQLPVGRYYRNRPDTEDPVGAGWNLSQYDQRRWGAVRVAANTGPVVHTSKTEIDMLAAEGHIIAGNFAAAAALIDISRTRNGLPALTGVVLNGTTPVPGGGACVPQVPVGPNYTTTACGNMLEAMKYEKRMETAFTGFMQWYRDSRGWGDLVEGTVLEWPVPYQEMQARRGTFYDGTNRAGVSTYRFGNGNDK